MISNKELLGFTWPPKMPSFQPKQKKHYKHFALIVLNSDPETEYAYEFTSEKSARAHIKTAKEAKNIYLTKYEKQEIPITTEEGVIL